MSDSIPTPSSPPEERPVEFDAPLWKRHLDYQREVLEERKRAVAEAAAERPDAGATPIRAGDLETLPYGPPDDSGHLSGEIIATFGEVESEYASLRRAAGLMDFPQRATLRVTGSERRDFLNRMLTNELKDLDAGVCRRSFWLNRKGRIDADLLLIETGEALLIDLDIHHAAHTVKTLDDFLFAEDVAIRNVTDESYRIVVHGPKALLAIASAAGATDFQLAPGEAKSITIAGQPVVAARADEIGAPGVHLVLPRAHVERIWNALLASDQPIGRGKRRVRPVGWFAYNIARIEAGTPLFNVDFGATNLPHESGVLRERVSFTKGCYLGQEVVARMESLGQPKQKLIGLKPEGQNLPIAGAQVFTLQEEEGRIVMGEPIGAVTSSTPSPLRGGEPVCFAMVRTRHARIGTALAVSADGELDRATVTELSFLPEGFSDA